MIDAAASIYLKKYLSKTTHIPRGPKSIFNSIVYLFVKFNCRNELTAAINASIPVIFPAHSDHFETY
ncbi:MAG: hypothetical protein XE10_0415 [Methanoculleus marisnigri]|jgi:hypothetical protein|uniref:Uncharacterized protein n=1 Tax=Methanoculleus marisnigri TaxID=2198 RepID=A0A101IYM9_9EURY|nr:MAG: hypothetical protein XE10_0415 [Methanoculleus marisnigri]